MGLKEEMLLLGDRAVTASRALSLISSARKREILRAMADEIVSRRQAITSANSRDMEEARKMGLSSAMLDRLNLTDSRIDTMAAEMREVAELRDPIGEVLLETTRPNGLKIRKVRVPIGVIAIIYESRPNVTADVASLCIKSSNAVVLRGGTESFHSNRAIAEALQAGGESKGLPPYSVQLVQTTDRDAVRELVQMEGKIDLVIPRGGEGLIRAVAEMARVPVIKHYKGVCHTYVDASADLETALRVCENAKCQRPGVCNAMETLLVNEKVAKEFLPKVAHLLESRGVELRGDETARKIVPSMKPATEDDWYAEYLDLILAVKVVPEVRAAVHHINAYGSHLSDAIITTTAEHEAIFTQEVDSAVVYVNTSTRFTDGGEFGMGAEMGISTDKLHARGPMGVDELTSYKYVVVGNGQVRS